MTPDNREHQQMIRKNASKMVCEGRDFGPGKINQTIRQLYLQRILARILVKFPLPERHGAERGSSLPH